MADLDDFFAKKDRKKAKGNKKFTTTEEIAKKLEETGKKVEKPKPKEKPLNPESSNEIQQVEEEDEWKDFEEEKKDYTGLKIGNLTVNDMTESDDERGTTENSSDNELVDGSSKSGPWKKTDKPEPQTEAVPEKVEPKEEPVEVKKASYKAPALRRAAVAPAPTRLRNKNIAPDISSEEYFPTLNAKQPSQNDNNSPWGKKKPSEGTFEEVRNRGGTRTYTNESQAQAPKLSLGNKYGALSQDQS